MTEDKKCLLAQMIIARLIKNWEKKQSLGRCEEYYEIINECNELREILGELDLTIEKEIMERF